MGKGIEARKGITMEKLNYEAFVNEAMEIFKSLIPAGYEVIRKDVYKTNVVLDSFSIRQIGHPDINTAPVMYFKELYSSYLRENSTVRDICQKVIRELEENTVNREEVTEFVTAIWQYSFAQPFLQCKLWNKEWNKKALLHTPHIVIDDTDLAVVFFIMMECVQGRITVTDDLQHAWGVSLDQLYEDALKNMAEDYCLIDANDIMALMVQDAMSEMVLDEEFEDELPIEVSGGAKGYVLTNKERYLGAAAILLPGVLKDIYERMGGDFCIIPSSVHEMLIFEKTLLADEYAEFIEEVNYHMDVEERLDCRPYLYDVEHDKIYRA